MNPGKYQGKAVDYCMTVSEKGDPFVTVLFEIHPEGNNLTWRGGLATDKQLEITIKALKVLGFHGSVKDLAGGKASGCLDLDKVVELDIVHEIYKDKKYAKIQWVNEVGGGGFKNKLTEVEAVRACAGLNLDAVFAREGIKPLPTVRHNPVASAPVSLEDIPF